MATSTTGNKLTPPYGNPIADQNGMVTTAWQSVFRLLKNLLDPIGYEINFQLANNQIAPADITGLSVDAGQFSQAIVEFLIQRMTTGTGATELIESGHLILTYRPAEGGWQLNVAESGVPDSSGITFMITPFPFVATYDHTTSAWSHSLSLPPLKNGQSVQLTLGISSSLPTGYAALTTYYVIAWTGSTFQLSASLGGSAVAATTNNGSGTITVKATHAVDGQVQYTSSNITGTASISKIAIRIRTLGAKNSQYSQPGAR